MNIFKSVEYVTSWFNFFAIFLTIMGETGSICEIDLLFKQLKNANPVWFQFLLFKSQVSLTAEALVEIRQGVDNEFERLALRKISCRIAGHYFDARDPE